MQRQPHSRTQPRVKNPARILQTFWFLQYNKSSLYDSLVSNDSILDEHFCYNSNILRWEDFFLISSDFLSICACSILPFNHRFMEYFTFSDRWLQTHEILFIERWHMISKAHTYISKIYSGKYTTKIYIEISEIHHKTAVNVDLARMREREKKNSYGNANNA